MSNPNQTTVVQPAQEPAPEKSYPMRIHSFAASLSDITNIIADKNNQEPIKRFEEEIRNKLAAIKAVPFFIDTDLGLPKSILIMGEIDKTDTVQYLNNVIQSEFKFKLPYTPGPSYKP